jgi:hypothetical protein
MAKRRRTRRVKSSDRISETPKYSDPEPEYSFDPQAIICMADVGYGIREAIVERAKVKSKVKKCIPKSVVLAVIKEFKLEQYLSDED